MYVLAKTIHVSTVAVSVGLFLLRLYWSYRAPDRLHRRWVRLVPHAIDTLLLVSAIALTLEIRQYPFVDSWLTAKVLALIAYIVCGSLALKRARTERGRRLAAIAAITCVAYILAVALTHDPLPFARAMF